MIRSSVPQWRSSGGLDAVSEGRLDKPDDAGLSHSDPGEWFVSLHAYSGADTKNIQVKNYDANYRDSPVAADPGTAGRSSEPIWWAFGVGGTAHPDTVITDHAALQATP